MRRSVIALIGMFLFSGNLDAQSQSRAVFDDALDAWDQGRYPEALIAFDSLLAGPEGGDYLRPIALLTGEMFTTVEMAEDGTKPGWSPDGRYLSFEIPSNAPTGTRIVPLEGQAEFELPGTSATFSPDGRSVAYLMLERSDEWEAARAAVRRNIPVNSRADREVLFRALNRVDAEFTTVAVYDMGSRTHTPLPTDSLAIFEVQFGAFDGSLIYMIAGDPEDVEQNDVYTLRTSGELERLTDFPANKRNLQLTADGRRGIMTVADAFVGVVDLESGDLKTYSGRAPAVSRDGSMVVFLAEDEGDNLVMAMPIDSQPIEIYRTENALDYPAVAPAGGVAAWQEMLREDWELMMAPTEPGDAARLTTEIQHDLFPRFLSDDVLLAVIGEGRHRRSYLYDAESGMRLRLFHNNTIRTVSPEYEWAVSPNGSRIAIVAERDGNTISPERGVYIVFGERQVGVEGVLERVRANLAAEEDLRRRGREIFESIADRVSTVVADVSTTRIFRYADVLHSFGSKFITEPGNGMAIE
ncbi:MAG: hypothetical protein OEZ54_07270, partial [Gemmatimonadota bacterium]|nr:hypothetical protein [Gemmatimonadota bacterium]